MSKFSVDQMVFATLGLHSFSPNAEVLAKVVEVHDNGMYTVVARSQDTGAIALETAPAIQQLVRGKFAEEYLREASVTSLNIIGILYMAGYELADPFDTERMVERVRNNIVAFLSSAVLVDIAAEGSVIQLETVGP